MEPFPQLPNGHRHPEQNNSLGTQCLNLHALLEQWIGEVTDAEIVQTTPEDLQDTPPGVYTQHNTQNDSTKDEGSAATLARRRGDRRRVEAAGSRTQAEAPRASQVFGDQNTSERGARQRGRRGGANCISLTRTRCTW